MIWASTLSDVYNRFLARTRASVTGISDLPLDYAQRAQETLWLLKEWSPLIKRVSLTVTDNVATLPSDFGRFIMGGVYDDTDADGYPDYFYYLNGDEDRGYTWQNDFSDNTVAPTLQIKFNNTPSAPYIAYVAKLPELTGKGSYIFFSKELMFAQMIFDYITDRDKTDPNAYQAASNRLDQAKRQFINAVQYMNNTPYTQIRNASGERVYGDGYDLDGGDSQPMHNDHDDPSEHPNVR